MTTATATGPGGARSRRRYLTIGLFLLPALLVYGVFVLMPIAQAAWYSLFDWNGLEPLTDFVGLDNFVELFTRFPLNEQLPRAFVQRELDGRLLALQ